jgi:hypothetical protein
MLSVTWGGRTFDRLNCHERDGEGTVLAQGVHNAVFSGQCAGRVVGVMLKRGIHHSPDGRSVSFSLWSDAKHDGLFVF